MSLNNFLYIQTCMPFFLCTNTKIMYSFYVTVDRMKHETYHCAEWKHSSENNRQRASLNTNVKTICREQGHHVLL